MTSTPWGEIGYIVYKRTYARPTKGGTEEFPDTVNRVVEACNKQLKCNFTTEEQEELRDIFLQLKGMVAGRFLWQLGTKTVNDLGLASLQNCAFSTVDHPVRPFTWAMDMLMLGSGVGYNIQKEFVYELPRVRRSTITRKDTTDADFIVPDSREGWVNLLRKVLESHFDGDGIKSYSTVCIRSAGAPIKGFGGTASGPEILCTGIGQINEVLNKRAGKKLRPIDCLDIMNIIGSIVVAGNVRRSAQIAIGDMDDLQFLNAKRWDLGNVPNWRAMSNNSVVCNDIALLPDAFWEGYRGNGEPYGLINLDLSRRVGRLGDSKYPDPLVAGYNPCAEQSLADKETCCLAEIYLPNITSYEEFMKVSTYLYRINKHSLALKCHHPETQEIVHKHMRMGIGVTGYLQATEAQKQWLPKAYEELRTFDKEYSAARGWNESVKLTTVKPSGTLSLLPGVTHGAHPGYSQYHIRRVRMAASSELIPLCISSGYHVEPVKKFDGTDDHSTMVVEFPVEFPEHTVFADDMTALDQLEVVKRLQTEWSDNSVSCTIYYSIEELDTVKEWLATNYNEGVKSCSFMLRQDHGFAQAPLEKISKDKYLELRSKVTPVTSGNIKESDMELDDCEGGACPIK